MGCELFTAGGHIALELQNRPLSFSPTRGATWGRIAFDTV